MSTDSTTNVSPPASVAPVVTGRSGLETDLRALFADKQPSRVMLNRLLQVAQKHTQARFVGLFQQDAAGQLQKLTSYGNLAEFAEQFAPQQFLDVCRAAGTRRDVISKCLSETARCFAVAVPVMAPGQQVSILSALVGPGQSGVPAQIKAIEMIAGAMSQWRLTDQLDRLDWEARTSAAVVELISHIEAAESLRAAEYFTVNQLQQLLGAEQVVLGLRRRGSAGIEIHAVSGVAEFDKNSETMGSVQAALDESLVRDKLTAWPPLAANERYATLAHRKLIDNGGHEAAVSAPLTTVNEKPVGALLLVGRREVLHMHRRMAAIDAMRPHIATALAARQAAEPGPLRRAVAAVFGDGATVNRRTMVLSALVASCLLPLVPWRYRVKTDCLVEPVARRFVVAPYDGLLQSSLVRPGSMVSAGDVLARMDDRELRWELSRLAADRGRAVKKRDVAMAAHDTSESQLAELEREGLDVKIKLLKHREQDLEITTPLTGMVLKGDLEDAEGAPVQAGQALFEVAPLDPVKLELAVVEEDLPMVQPGMRVTAMLDGYRGEKVTGEVIKIHPRSEIRDQQNVFIAEVELPNPDSQLRPGMSGVARVQSKFKPLGWIWFHKAVHRTRVFLGV